LPKQVTGLISDVRRIADGMQSLPELLRTLKRIETRTTSMDAEVKLMRASVERLEQEVQEVQGSLHPLKRAFKRNSPS
jgi:predicted  nucleic acid-binding Zn-ribbon protein